LAAARGWSKEKELGLSLAEMGEAGDNVCGVALLCQWAAILVSPRDRDDWGRRKGLSNFDQKARGVTEREMGKVVVGPLWQLLWPGKKGSFGWF
jgi:hypothetical protein